MCNADMLTVPVERIYISKSAIALQVSRSANLSQSGINDVV